MNVTQRSDKPQLSFWQIWNMCFGFLGLQVGFALQNSNVSRIFQTLGASFDQIPVLWIAAPLTGLLVQPIIGYLSDRTWTRLGRRRPYFLVGALLASAALLVMPRSPALWVAAGVLWILDASINISMEPFRAFVGDQLSPKQRPAGYSMQSFFIGIGAVFAGLLPWLFARAGVSNHVEGATGAAAIPDSLYYSFDVGAIVLLAAVLWTVFSSREYSPEQLRGFADSEPPATAGTVRLAAKGKRRWSLGMVCALLGIGALAAVYAFNGKNELFLVGGGLLAWGLALLIHEPGVTGGMFGAVMDDLWTMPYAMRRLIPVQFCSWLALFSMWIYATAVVTEVHFGSSDPSTKAYNDGADWVGVLFSTYNGFAALAAIVIPFMVRRIGLRKSHLVNLWLGGAALLSFLVIRDPVWLLASMLGIGFAWASILSLPYALLSDSVPAEKMGVYMGIFNFFIVIPQLLAASLLGVVLKWLFHGAPIYALALGGVSFLAAGVLALRVPEASSSAPRTIS